MELHEAVKKAMLSIKIGETIPESCYPFIRTYLQQLYVAGWEQGRRDLIDMQNLSQCKGIAQYNKDKKLIATYRSLQEAAKQSGFTTEGIRKAIRRGTSTKQKWIWEYLSTPASKPQSYT